MKLGAGRRYNSESEDNSARRTARWLFFKVIAEQRGTALKSLHDDVFMPHFYELYRRRQEAFKRDDDAHAMLARTCSELDKPSTITEIQAVIDADNEALICWQEQHGLTIVGDWLEPLARGIMEGWWNDLEIEVEGWEVIQPIWSTANVFQAEMARYDALPLDKAHSVKINLTTWHGPPNLQQVLSCDPNEIVVYGYDKVNETRKAAKKQIMLKLEHHVDAFLDMADSIYEAGGFKRMVHKRPTRRDPEKHFYWLYLKVFEHKTYEEIAAAVDLNISWAAVGDACRGLAGHIGIDLSTS